MTLPALLSVGQRVRTRDGFLGVIASVSNKYVIPPEGSGAYYHHDGFGKFHGPYCVMRSDGRAAGYRRDDLEVEHEPVP